MDPKAISYDDVYGGNQEEEEFGYSLENESFNEDDVVQLDFDFNFDEGGSFNDVTDAAIEKLSELENEVDLLTQDDDEGTTDLKERKSTVRKLRGSFKRKDKAKKKNKKSGRQRLKELFVHDELDYFKRSYTSHWVGYFFYGLNESGALVPWVILLLFFPGWVSKLVGLDYFWVGQYLVIPGIIYVLMGIPELIGFLFAQGLRRFGPLNGYPFKVGAVSLFPFIHDKRFHCRIVVYDAKFGNPPGFPFPYFLECGRLDMEGSISFKDIKNTMMGKKTKAPLKGVNDFEYFMKIDFSHIEVCDALCNFQMYDGKFNINEFTRILATGEAKTKLKGDPFPNQLTVEVRRAQNLKPHRLKKTIDPYVVVRVRRNIKETRTQTETLNPMFNEKLVFNLDDPSVVMEIAVYDRDAPDGGQAAFIGHWAMTTKYLIYDPTFTFHVDNKDFKTYYRGDRKDGAYGFEGWVPLASKNWEQMGEKGQLEISLLWQHVEKSELTDDFKEKRKYTALEQLTQQSNEDALRFGSWSRFRHWLSHEPFCYDIRRFTVRRTKFYLQDLFRGYRGKPEMMRKNEKGFHSDYVPIDFLEITDRFRPKAPDVGITSYHVFYHFFVGLVFKFLKGGKVGRALAQIMGGGVFGLGINFANVFRGDWDNTTIGPQGILDAFKVVSKQARSGAAVVNQKVKENARNRAEHRIAVDANDSDFLLEKADMSGYLDRCAASIPKGALTEEKYVQMAKKSGKFKSEYFEIKGESLFYRKAIDAKKKKVYNVTWKVRLKDVGLAIFVRSQQEIILDVQMEDHVLRLRKSKDKPAEESSSLQKWFQMLESKGVPVTEVE